MGRRREWGFLMEDHVGTIIILILAQWQLDEDT